VNTSLNVSSTQDEYEEAKLFLAARLDPIPGWIIEMELCGPTLADYLTSDGAKWTDVPQVDTCQFQLTIVRCLIRGLKYIQSKGVLHCDLKPSNILFSAGDKEFFHLPILIGDFGLSLVVMPEAGGKRVFSKRGNDKYKAPELFADSRSSLFYTLQAEIYSMGMIILEVLLSGRDKQPFKAKLSEWIRTFDNEEIDPAIQLL